jgi:DNA oxidative demethylase
MHLKQYLTIEQQQYLLTLCREVYLASPMWTPTTKRGNRYSYQNTSCGKVGWISDEKGYYYSEINPVNNRPFPPMPAFINQLAIDVATSIGVENYNPETCLINYYKSASKLGLHQDNSEKNLTAPIISISLGDDAIFLLGTKKYSDKPQEILLKSGDIFVLHGETRMAYHGIKQINSGTSNLLRNGGRLNLTIRQVY